jgi:hypothetical protein
MAIARQESNYTADVRTLTGGDLLLGGSYGLCQMSYNTGRSLDKYCTPARLMNPEYNAKLAAQLCVQNSKACQGRMEDIISRYNSGKDFYRAPDITKLHYVPNVQKFMAFYKQQADIIVARASALDSQKTPQP